MVGAAELSDEWGPIQTEIRRGPPTDLKPQAVNARFMTAAQMDQLVANIRADGRLTSLPLTYLNPDTGLLETISGHHRAEAAERAELAEIDYIVILTRLSEARKAAIQLSHNAITGQDDPSILAAMYAGLDLSAKSYSGLDDSALGALKDIDLAGLAVGVKYQEMNLFFLPDDAEVVKATLDRIDKAARKQAALVCDYEDFDAFFALAIRVKTKFEASNSAIAMRIMITLANERLAQLEADDGQH